MDLIGRKMLIEDCAVVIQTCSWYTEVFVLLVHLAGLYRLFVDSSFLLAMLSIAHTEVFDNQNYQPNHLSTTLFAGLPAGSRRIWVATRKRQACESTWLRTLPLLQQMSAEECSQPIL